LDCRSSWDYGDISISGEAYSVDLTSMDPAQSIEVNLQARWRPLDIAFRINSSHCSSGRTTKEVSPYLAWRSHDFSIQIINRVNSGDGQITFDMFIQSMVTVKTLTEVFKRWFSVTTNPDCSMDTDRDGYITISFEQFLEVILRQR